MANRGADAVNSYATPSGREDDTSPLHINKIYIGDNDTLYQNAMLSNAGAGRLNIPTWARFARVQAVSAAVSWSVGVDGTEAPTPSTGAPSIAAGSIEWIPLPLGATRRLVVAGGTCSICWGG